jgi:hypothetical protein
MSTDPKPLRSITVPDFVRAKSEKRRLSVLTAYDCLWASILDEAGVDALLVGDTVGMVVQGRSSTLPVTMDQMIYHGEMVARGAKRALVIVDLPFMSYQVSPRQAVKNAGRILKETGASAVKLEGGEGQEETIAALARVDIPVMAHIGMRPQSVRKYGRMSAIQRDADQLLKDAKAATDPAGRSESDHRRNRDPDNRHRRGTALRRPGAGHPRHARPDRLQAEVPEGVRRPANDDRRCGPFVRGRCPRGSVPGRVALAQVAWASMPGQMAATMRRSPKDVLSSEF